jgi:putative transposase
VGLTKSFRDYTERLSGEGYVVGLSDLFDGHPVNQKCVRRLMRLMGLMPIYQKPNTSRTAQGHKNWRYQVRGLRVDRPNQVRAADITYLPMRRGFLYLVAIIDWFRP